MKIRYEIKEYVSIKHKIIELIKSHPKLCVHFTDKDEFLDFYQEGIPSKHTSFLYPRDVEFRWNICDGNIVGVGVSYIIKDGKLVDDGYSEIAWFEKEGYKIIKL